MHRNFSLTIKLVPRLPEADVLVAFCIYSCYCIFPLISNRSSHSICYFAVKLVPLKDLLGVCSFTILLYA